MREAGHAALSRAVRSIELLECLRKAQESAALSGDIRSLEDVIQLVRTHEKDGPLPESLTNALHRAATKFEEAKLHKDAAVAMLQRDVLAAQRSGAETGAAKGLPTSSGLIWSHQTTPSVISSRGVGSRFDQPARYQLL